ncbi:MAG: hypothetical protein ABJQ34_19865 [Paracoccaceae bacterium]
MAETPEAAVLAYDQFELVVPHIDLEDCPGDIEAMDVFFRATIANSEIHVIAFSSAGVSPLLDIKSFPIEGLAELLK